MIRIKLCFFKKKGSCGFCSSQGVTLRTRFELWCWRRLLRVPWTARRSNQSILKEISPEYSLEGRTEDEMVGWHHRLGGHEFE